MAQLFSFCGSGVVNSVPCTHVALTLLQSPMQKCHGVHLPQAFTSDVQPHALCFSEEVALQYMLGYLAA